MEIKKTTHSITLFLFCILAAFNSCHGQNNTNAFSKEHPSGATGESVKELSNSIFYIFQDKKNNYWFGSDGQGVFYYDGKTTINFTTKYGLCNDRVRGIQEDKEGNIYFNTLGGISKFNPSSRLPAGVNHFTTLAPIEGSDWKSEPDDLWFIGNSMENAAYRYDGKSLYRLKFPKSALEDEYHAANPNGVASPYGVYTIYKDSKGNLWFGTAAFGACRYNARLNDSVGQGKSFDWLDEKHLSYPASGGSFGIRSIIEDKDGKFWICNTSYRYNIYDAAKKKGFVHYKREKGIENLKAPDGDAVYYLSIIKDNNQDLWMASYGAGVWKYDGQHVTHYPVKVGEKDITVFSIYKDNKGNLWLGTHEHGAYVFNGKTFERFSP